MISSVWCLFIFIYFLLLTQKLQCPIERIYGTNPLPPSHLRRSILGTFARPFMVMTLTPARQRPTFVSWLRRWPKWIIDIDDVSSLFPLKQVGANYIILFLYFLVFNILPQPRRQLMTSTGIWPTCSLCASFCAVRGMRVVSSQSFRQASRVLDLEKPWKDWPATGILQFITISVSVFDDKKCRECIVSPCIHVLNHTILQL